MKIKDRSLSKRVKPEIVYSSVWLNLDAQTGIIGVEQALFFPMRGTIPKYPALAHSTSCTRIKQPMKPEDLQKLVTFTMPFGKYKGRVIGDLPGHYLNWFAREGFPNGELGRLLALMQEIDHNGLKAMLDPLRK